METLKLFVIKLLGVLAGGSIFLFMGAAFIYGCAWVLQWLALSVLIEIGVVTNASEFWDYTLIFYTLIIVPPIYMLIFRAFPSDVQNNITGTVKGVALAFLYLGDWIAKVVLLAGGAYLYYITFAA